jgi:hypothetical protein
MGWDQRPVPQLFSFLYALGPTHGCRISVSDSGFKMCRVPLSRIHDPDAESKTSGSSKRKYKL